MKIKELAIILTTFREFARFYLNSAIKGFMIISPRGSDIITLSEHDKKAYINRSFEDYDLFDECTLKTWGYYGWRYKDSAYVSFRVINSFVNSIGYSIVDILSDKLPECDSLISFKIKKGIGHHFNFQQWMDEKGLKLS